MNKLQIAESIINGIKNQALLSEKEIYGWLIGYQQSNIMKVLAFIPCENYVEQTQISAIPATQEFQKIASMMPQGIGPIGIYHSHPISSNIFHSHTDDKTLLNLNRLFNGCVSIVTTGKEIKFYKINRENKTFEIGLDITVPQIPECFMISLNEKFVISIAKESIKNKNESQKIKITIQNFLTDFFEKIWKDLQFYYKGNILSGEESIIDYLAGTSSNSSIQLKIPLKYKTNLKNQKHSFTDLEINNSINSKKKIKFNLNLNSKFPFYINDKTIRLMELKEAIKTELISNNIIQKIINCRINHKEKSILLPNESYISFFGFYVKILNFDDKKLNRAHFSIKNFELFIRLLNILRWFNDNDLDSNERVQIEDFLIDVKNFSKNRTWKNQISEKLKNINKKIKF